jgi:hypothetical protein
MRLQPNFVLRSRICRPPVLLISHQFNQNSSIKSQGIISATGDFVGLFLLFFIIIIIFLLLFFNYLVALFTYVCLFI